MLLFFLAFVSLVCSRCVSVEHHDRSHTEFYKQHHCSTSASDFSDFKTVVVADGAYTYTPAQLEADYTDLVSKGYRAHYIIDDVSVDTDMSVDTNLKNVRGNIIMSRVEWVTELERLPHDDAEKEKEDVYGSVFIMSASNAIASHQSSLSFRLIFARVVFYILVFVAAVGAVAVVIARVKTHC